MMLRLAFAAVLATFLFAFACDPVLPTAGGVGGAGGGAGGGLADGFAIAVEPGKALDAAASVLRIRIDSPPAGAEVDRVVVVEGTLAPEHLRELQEQAISAALSMRIVASIAWSEHGAFYIAPTSALQAGDTYSIALGDLSLATTFTVAALQPPMLPRVWPPAGLGATIDFGVWCGSAPLAAKAVSASLDPGGPKGRLELGVDGIDSRCIAFHGGAAKPSGPVVPPPAVAGITPPPALDPRPFALEQKPTAISNATCMPGEVEIGPGCAIVEDDRIVGRAPASPALWTVSGEGIDVAFTTNPGDPFLLAPVPADKKIELAISIFDTAGRVTRSTFRATTLPPMPHVVLNEELANPIGPEPAQEWVELVNDGKVAADLTGYVLVDLGGLTPLPSAMLAPGAFALLVGDDFQTDDGFDPPVAPGVLLLRVPRVGKSGLSNDGEPLSLRDAAGHTVSAMPAVSQQKAGMSLARISPTAPDGVASSFVLATPTPGAPNGLSPSNE